MDFISLGIHKGFKTKGERTWRQVQRALPIKDIPSVHAAAELAPSSLWAHIEKCSHLSWAWREELGRESHPLLVKCHRAIEPPGKISCPYFFKAANVQWESFEICSKPTFCQYTADLISASLVVSQGSDGICRKRRALWLRNDLGGLWSSFLLGWTTLGILSCAFDKKSLWCY